LKIHTVEFIATLVDPRAPFPDDLPQVAFMGRSNVGKSSLINTLLGRTRKKIAHVSATPGKTQGLNFYRVNDAFFLVDLPGFGFARAPTAVREGWVSLIRGYLSRPDGPRAVTFLLDVRRTPSAEDMQMLEDLSQRGIPTLIVVTKVDKLTHSAKGREIPRLAERLGLPIDQILPFSSHTGEGRTELLEALESILTPHPVGEEGEPVEP